MKKFKVYINGTNEDQQILYDMESKQEVVRAYDYDERFESQVEGFFIGLNYCNIDYEYDRDKDETLNPDNPLFEELEFEDFGYDD